VELTSLAEALVAAANGQQALSADLGSLASALVDAIGPAVSETVKLFTQTIPATAQNMVATGKFAHLPVLVVNSVFLGIVTPVAPFLVALRDSLPLPIGTADGLINESYKLFVNAPVTTALTILGLMADVVDSGLSPTDAFLGSLNALSTGATSAVESIGKIVAAVTGGALPFSGLPFAATAAPEGSDNARTLAIASRSAVGSPDAPNVVPAGVNPSSPQYSTDTVTVTLSTPAPAEGVKSEDSAPTGAGESDHTSGGESPDSAGNGVTANGGTDMSDGNHVKPGTAGSGPSGRDHDPSTTVTEENATGAASSGDTASDSHGGPGGEEDHDANENGAAPKEKS
jgi:hypothetical protein